MKWDDKVTKYLPSFELYDPYVTRELTIHYSWAYPPATGTQNFWRGRKTAAAARQVADRKRELSRVPQTKLSLPLSAYAGNYSGEMFGDATVTEERGKLVVRFLPSPYFVGDLDHWHFDTFSIKWRDSIVYPFAKGFVTFTLNAEGKVDEMKIDVPNSDFDFKELEFKRKP